MKWSEIMSRATERSGTHAAEFAADLDARLVTQACVEAIVKAARAAATSVGGDDLIAALVIFLDLVGTGGRLGCGGTATTRLPAFNNLGDRKQADGQTWMAASAAAFQILCPQATIRPTSSGIGWAWPDEPPRSILTIETARQIDALQQMRALACLAVWQDVYSAGIVATPPPRQRGEFDVLGCVDASEEWRALLVRLDGELGAGTAAIPCPDAVDTVN